jgi:hypothetical protein
VFTIAQARLLISVPFSAMGAGCLITVRTPSLVGECVVVGYLVAEQDIDRAVRIIERNIAKTTDKVVAVSRVSEELLDVLGVRPGGFTRADGRPFERPAMDRRDQHSRV